MSRETPEIAGARLEVERARSRLIETARELQARLSPGTLTRNVLEGAKHKGADLAEDAVDAVKKRPVAFGSAVAVIALFLAREPLMDLAGKVADGVTSKREAKKARKRSTRQPKEQPTDTETVQ